MVLREERNISIALVSDEMPGFRSGESPKAVRTVRVSGSPIGLIHDWTIKFFDLYRNRIRSAPLFTTYEPCRAP